MFISTSSHCTWIILIVPGIILNIIKRLKYNIGNNNKEIYYQNIPIHKYLVTLKINLYNRSNILENLIYDMVDSIVLHQTKYITLNHYQS